MRFFVDQLNKSYMTPDDTLIPPLGEPDCRSCAAFQKHAQEYVSLKHRFSSPALELVSVQPAPGAPDGKQFLSVKVHQLPASVIDAAGTVMSTESDSTFDGRALLTWQGGKWLIYDLA